MLEMRDLKALDTFKMVNILNKVGIVGELKYFMESDEGKSLIKQYTEKESEKETEKKVDTVGLGVQLIMSVMESVMDNLETVEKPLNIFLASITETNLKTIENLPIAEYVALIVKFFQKPELVGFLDVITPLLKSEASTNLETASLNATMMLAL